MHQRNNTLSIHSTLKRHPVPSGVPFLDIKDKVAGKSYDLSLVFIGDTLSQRLNSEHRDIHKPTDILSFPLSDTSGEIFINIPYVKRSFKKYGRSYKGHIAFLFIHGLLHLKGYSHGSTMERREDTYCKYFNIS